MSLRHLLLFGSRMLPESRGTLHPVDPASSVAAFAAGPRGAAARGSIPATASPSAARSQVPVASGSSITADLTAAGGPRSTSIASVSPIAKH